jgi:ribosomal protein S18 acetylase RimI-like enzyme
VAPDLRRRGVARALLTMLLLRARRAGMLHAFLEVRPSNAPAMALYESMGFQRIGLRRGYYQAQAGREDAIVYRKSLDHLQAGGPR